MDKYLESFQSKTSDQFEKIRAIFKECQGLRNSIQEAGQESQQNLFEESENKMREFLHDVLEEEMKGQIKKIKLNWGVKKIDNFDSCLKSIAHNLLTRFWKNK